MYTTPVSPDGLFLLFGLCLLESQRTESEHVCVDVYDRNRRQKRYYIDTVRLEPRVISELRKDKR